MSVRVEPELFVQEVVFLGALQVLVFLALLEKIRIFPSVNGRLISVLGQQFLDVADL